jgi:hypothetical protein
MVEQRRKTKIFVEHKHQIWKISMASKGERFNIWEKKIKKKKAQQHYGSILITQS